ncbi:hypothetical protein DSCO28_18990 [Desulfosarcina ovata subsp. sediminis]|uniref:DUF86 domain-containing protein n=1 Tax=Desulfosarcina ovata subsp. sediminis TaxID=885957 RepID=A0A5K7ZRE4_9BACT|nr:DUF86 domain-containing protein [Desulfosarcina ovata]BBO81333.1 hypothetical protein DSCO28_18990 [Desulfosarcina ovata subsp. sediminis]
MVDENIILRKLSELEAYTSQIQDFRSISVDDYKNDWKSQRIIERTLQMMVESCVDIAGHIISDKKYRIPESYADAFIVLRENGIVDNKICRTMEQIAKFRNVIVHHYDRVDAEIVVGILRNRLKDFDKYKNAIVNWLKNNSHRHTQTTTDRSK